MTTATQWLDNVVVSTPTTGTGTLTLGAVPTISNGQTELTAGVTNGAILTYRIDDVQAWEVGYGTYTVSGRTLTRTPMYSSNNNALINLDGNGVVRIVLTAEDIASIQSAMGAYLPLTGGTLTGALQVNSTIGATGTVTGGGFTGNSYNSNGNNSGYFFTGRGGAGSTFGTYSGDGSKMQFWESSSGDIAWFDSANCYFNEGLIVATAPQVRMIPNQNSGNSYGSMWYNDGSWTYLLLTNQNDALGGWNGLRPFMINDSNGNLQMNQGVYVTGGLNSDNITDRGWGIVYSNYASNYVGFQWTGTCQLVIDGNGQGTLITSNNWTSYIPNANNNPSGCVLRSGDTMSGNLTVNASTQLSSGCHVGGNGIQYYSLANNTMGLKWVGNATQIIVDGSYQGTINTSSDGGRKANLGGIEVDPLADILQIKLQSYDQTFIEGEGSYHYPIGMIAQNLLNIGPDMVDVATEHDPETGEPTDETSLGVILLPLLSRLVGAVQQLSARVEALEAAPSRRTHR